VIGVDLVKNERIGGALERFGERFLRRVYTERELEYCFSTRDRVPCLAARWACKEAVLKAVYQCCGILLRLKEVEVLGERGRPARVNIRRPEALKALEPYRLVVSLSHERDYSVAVALLERR